MIIVHVIDRDAAVRIAARRALERAGFAVSEAADETCAADLRPELVIADLAVISVAAIQGRHPAARILAISDAEGLPKPFTPSQLLAAVRLCLAQPDSRLTAATRGSRQR